MLLLNVILLLKYALVLILEKNYPELFEEQKKQDKKEEKEEESDE